MSDDGFLENLRNVREKIYNIIEKEPGRKYDKKKHPEEYKEAKLRDTFNYLLMAIIWINIFVVVINSFEEFHNKYILIFNYIEYFSVIVFSIEYLLRIWVSPLRKSCKACINYKNEDFENKAICKRKDRISCIRYYKPRLIIPYLLYIFSFMGIIDILAILPFYLPLFINVDLRILRFLRMLRLLRVLKLIRYNNSLKIIGRVLKSQKEKLYITMMFMLIMILIASSIMYFVENKDQPDKFPNILATVWWAVGTLTTVGYGDVYPVTILGKVLGGFIAIMGIGLIALPSGIISSGLLQEASRKPKPKRKSQKKLIKKVRRNTND